MSNRGNTKLILILSSTLSVLLVAVIAFYARSSMSQMSRNNTELYSAYKISELLKSFRSSLNILENKRKGYIITGDPKFQEAYKAKESEIKVALKSMERYFSGRTEEETYYKLKDLTYRHLIENNSLSAGTDLSGFHAEGQEVENNVNTADEISAIADQINESLDKTTRVLLDNSIEYVKASRNWSVAGVLLTVLVSLIALFIVIRDINTRSQLEKELRRAKQQADENALLKERFVANMSHEIRTPLNAILGFTHLLEKTKMSVQQKNHLDAIQKSSSNLLNIINDILDFSKIEAGQLSFEKVAFSPSEILIGIHQMFSNKTGEKNIGFEVRTDKGVPALVYGDPNRLSQILINLCSNAIKFTENGKVTLTCEVKNIEHDLAALVFRVKDTGIGIAHDKIEHIFERFKQASSDTTRKYGGTGLGLSIVKDLVELQNGEIHIKSKENVGSEFIVNISYPLAHETAQVSAEVLLSELPLSDGSHQLLLVEDNELNQKLAKTYLESFGLRVDIAANGLEALNKINAKDYDLVLMDIQMPHMDGYQATEQIRNVLKKKFPIIAMTANSIRGEKEKCLAHGMNDYLSKPYRESDLRELMERHLNFNKNTLTATSEKKHSTLTDLNDFYTLTKGNKKFMQEMITLFLEGNPGDLELLRKSIKTGNYDLLRDTSHRMKTSVGFMGLKHLVELLDELEMLGEKSNSFQRAEEIVDQVIENCEAAQLKFAAELKKINAAA